MPKRLGSTNWDDFLTADLVAGTPGDGRELRRGLTDPSPWGASCDLSRSTEENYAILSRPFSVHREAEAMDEVEGIFASERAALDRTYHARYLPARRRLQDELIAQALRVFPGDLGPEENPWLLLTAGAMGAGKTSMVAWLERQGMFPLQKYIHVDPDAFRARLPEWSAYVRADPETAGNLTRKETNLMTEVTTLAAMARGLHVWQDGSLRNADFFLSWIPRIRQLYPNYRVAILHVTASEQRIRRRVLARGRRPGGRVVPEADLNDAIHRVPKAFDLLEPLADLAATVSTDSREPVLLALRAGRYTRRWWSGTEINGCRELQGAFRILEAGEVFVPQPLVRSGEAAASGEVEGMESERSKTRDHEAPIMGPDQRGGVLSSSDTPAERSPHFEAPAGSGVSLLSPAFEEDSVVLLTTRRSTMTEDKEVERGGSSADDTLLGGRSRRLGLLLPPATNGDISGNAHHETTSSNHPAGGGLGSFAWFRLRAVVRHLMTPASCAVHTSGPELPGSQDQGGAAPNSGGEAYYGVPPPPPRAWAVEEPGSTAWAHGRKDTERRLEGSVAARSLSSLGEPSLGSGQGQKKRYSDAKK